MSRAVHGFDLTPATLACFRACMAKQNIADVQLREPTCLTWKVSCGMEQLRCHRIGLSAGVCPAEGMVSALSQLRSRLATHGVLLLFVTPKNWITKLMIEKLWKANCYSREELRRALADAGFKSWLSENFLVPTSG